MALRTIVQDGDPILRKKTREVTAFDARLHTLIDDMRETLTDANGLGLAAPQVGIMRRVALVVDMGPEEDTVIELINPRIVAEEGSQEGPEGCLSFPGLWGVVIRPEKVTVEAQDRFGKPFRVSGEGLTARAFCHEIDHLDGQVFTEKATRFIDPEEAAAGREED
ncbi:peptide deformylase [Oscillospiraceae bacterium OttesenSCG-928-F05]|nr:peptide deformylase [Oscillospiraceae bacterium OttesenSCG-928-F05]